MGTSARNRLARRGSNAELLLWAGPLSQMALQVLSKWSMAFKEEGSTANSLSWGRYIFRKDSLPLRLISLREALGECDCRVRPWLPGTKR